MENYKILVIGDENIAKMIKENQSYTLYNATNKKHALKVINDKKPDIIIIDWEVEEINGINLIEKLKQEFYNNELPTFINIYTEDIVKNKNIQYFTAIDNVEYIRKPICKIELHARVNSMLRLAESTKNLKRKISDIKEKNRIFDSFIQNSPFAIVYYMIDGTIDRCNSKFAKLLGLRKEFIINTSLYKYKHFANNDFYKKDIEFIQNGKNGNDKITIGYNTYLIIRIRFTDSQSAPKGIICLIYNLTTPPKAYLELIENNGRELAANALRLLQIYEMHKSLACELENICLLPDSKKNKQIKEIANKLTNAANKNAHREFEARFCSVFESFNRTLLKKHSNLTPGELKLCAFLKLKLSSKEIANITYQTPKSIDMARYRLRKKIKLHRKESLVDYLMKIN